MQSNSSPEQPVSGSQEALLLPDGIRELTKEYQSIILQSLLEQEIAAVSISVFQIEPRGDSFLAGFRVRISSGEEIFVYAEPSSVRQGTPTKDNDFGENQSVSVWQYPLDPKLKSLASLVNIEPLVTIFSRLKLSLVPSQIELLTYRPGRRAMVKCSGGSESAFVKSLRPSRVEGVVSATRLARHSGVPAPRVIAWSPDGFAIFEALEGIELSQLNGGEISGAEAIRAALNALSAIHRVKTEAISRTPIIENYKWYFSRAIQAHPAEEQVLKKLEQKIAAIKVRNTDPKDQTTIHGDFHLGQVLVSRDDYSSVSGVIDLDDMGLGLVSDDIATMWSNCIASGRFTPSDKELKFWRECVEELELTRSPAPEDAGRLNGSIAVHLVAQTLSIRGLNPAVAHNLIKDAAMRLD